MRYEKFSHMFANILVCRVIFYFFARRWPVGAPCWIAIGSGAPTHVWKITFSSRHQRPDRCFCRLLARRQRTVYLPNLGKHTYSKWKHEDREKIFFNGRNNSSNIWPKQNKSGLISILYCSACKEGSFFIKKHKIMTIMKLFQDKWD